MQRFLKLVDGYTYPAVGGGVINNVEFVENQQMPSFGEYINSIPSLLSGNARLPKPIGADTKVPDPRFRCTLTASYCFLLFTSSLIAHC